MIRILCCLVFVSLFSWSYGQEKPNIIVIYTDDQGYADIGANGQVTDIKTPNIDALANEGVRLTAGYATAPQCMPSRAGLLTGRYQQRFGLDHNGLIPLPLDEILISQRLQKQGYTTGMAGKWHLEPNHQSREWIVENLPSLGVKNTYKASDIPFEKKVPYMSSNRGFDKTFQGYMTNYWATYTLDGEDLKAQWIKQEGYRLDVQTEAAVEFIKRNKEAPFFFYLSYYGPHVPLAATKKYMDRFPEDMPMRRRYCLAMMSAIDDGVGRLRATLKEVGKLDNTILFFISDNGAPLKLHMEDAPGVGPGWDGSLNTPWIGEKGMISEGGIRVPYIVNWPAGLPQGKVYDRPVSTLDVAATCLEVAGAKRSKDLDGVNLIPYLNGEKDADPHEVLFWRFWGQHAARVGNLKYLKAGDREYLFDVSTEVHERKNIIKEHPKTVKKIKKLLAKWDRTLKNPVLEFGQLGNEKPWYEYYFPKQI